MPKSSPDLYDLYEIIQWNGGGSVFERHSMDEVWAMVCSQTKLHEYTCFFKDAAWEN